MNLFAYLIITVAVLSGCAGLIYLTDREARHQPSFTEQMEACRQLCVASQAEAFQFGRFAGCVCVGQLP